jgi:hypothetical protein
MKKLLLLLVVMLLAFDLSGQDCKAHKDSLMYSQAYYHIIADSVGKAFSVVPVNVLEPTQYVWFADKIGQSNNNFLKEVKEEDLKLFPDGTTKGWSKKAALSWKLQAFDNESINDDTVFPSYRFPPSYVNNSELTYTMSFSPIFGNEFFVDLSLPPTHMGGGFIYYFIFNEDLSLKKVFREELFGL